MTSPASLASRAVSAVQLTLGSAGGPVTERAIATLDRLHRAASAAEPGALVSALVIDAVGGLDRAAGGSTSGWVPVAFWLPESDLAVIVDTLREVAEDSPPDFHAVTIYGLQAAWSVATMTTKGAFVAAVRDCPVPVHLFWSLHERAGDSGPVEEAVQAMGGTVERLA